MLLATLAYEMPTRPARVCRLESARTYGIARVHVRPAYVMNMPLTAKLLALLSPDAQTLGSGDVGSAGGDPMSGTHIHVDAHGVVTWQIA